MAPEMNKLGRPTPELGKIEQVEVRGIWENEAHDFTPWLASHLDLLGDALDMKLELVQREAAVGDFSLDILARDLTRNGAMVAIENQLERTDHSHLGQILTYAAGHDARTVIWVTPQFRDEHRAAVDWLNNWTPEEINFFGVEVSAIKIGESRPAPVFSLKASPNGWAKRAKQTATSVTSLDSGKRIQFYQPLVDALRERGYAMPAQARSWWNPVPSSVDKIVYYPHFVAAGTSVYLDIKTSDRGRVFDALHEEKASIEEALARPLTWERAKNKITLFADGTASIDDSPEKLAEARNWMLDALPRLKSVLDPRLERIVGEIPSEQSANDAPDPAPDA